jgi:hypothetical protein
MERGWCNALGGACHFIFCVVSLDLLILQLELSVRVRRRHAIGIYAATGRGTSGDAILALVLRERLEARLQPFPEVVAHILKFLKRHGEIRSRSALAGLAGGDENLHVQACVGGAGDSGNYISRSQGAFLAIRCLAADDARNNENTIAGIEHGWNMAVTWYGC